MEILIFLTNQNLKTLVGVVWPVWNYCSIKWKGWMFTKILTIITMLCPWSLFNFKFAWLTPVFVFGFWRIKFVINRNRTLLKVWFDHIYFYYKGLSKFLGKQHLHTHLFGIIVVHIYLGWTKLWFSDSDVTQHGFMSNTTNMFLIFINYI